MTTNKPTAPKDPLATGDCTEYQLGLVKKTVPNFPKKDSSREVFRAYFHALSVEGRIEKLRQQIADMGLERFESDECDLRPKQFRDELQEIDRLYDDGSLRALGRKDPLRHAMRALERLVDIASSEQYFETLVKYNTAADARRKALADNREQASRFRIGSAEERDLVARFRRYADDKKPIRKIPKMIHDDVANLDDAPSLMSIRRTLQRLKLIPQSKPRKQK